MAPETRVGLLVGLAFIICFAVILAHRGRHATSVGPQRDVAFAEFDVSGGLADASRAQAGPRSAGDVERRAANSPRTNSAVSTPGRRRLVPYSRGTGGGRTATARTLP
ncbi:MAG: hypothetical protein ACE5EX_10965, partial [Phycisphaerae bacterium]